MSRSRFNDGWTVGPNVSVFSEITGGATDSRPVTLPHDAMLDGARSADSSEGSSSGYFEGGAVSYRKSFLAPQEWESSVVELEFHGVYRDAMVYLNGVLVAHRPNGYLPFRARLDDALRYGETNRLRVDARAYRDSRWYSGLGIYRDVDLLVMPEVHLSPNGIRLSTPDIDDKRAVVLARTEVANTGRPTATRRVMTNMFDAEGRVVASEVSPVTIRGGGRELVDQRLYLEAPALWSVEQPRLYRTETRLLDGDDIADSAVNHIGVRRLQLDPRSGLRINGESVKLRGACIHHDNGLLGAVSIPEAEFRRVRILKEAGFNAIRSAHNPISPALLDACDRLGMLVMDEAFDMWTEGKQPFDYSLAFPEWWERDIEAMVTRDFNHPSVIMYSIGNEILDAGKPLGARIGRQLAQKVRAIDSTRFLTNGISGFVATLSDTVPMIQIELAGVPGGINDVDGIGKELVERVGRSQFVTDATAESHSVVDVVGHNYAAWRYESETAQFPNRVVVGTETLARDIDVNWRLVEMLPHVIGDFTWTGWDYLGEAGLGVTTYSSNDQGWDGGRYPALTAYCGDIDITGRRRPSSYFREIVFGLRKQPYIGVRRPIEPGVNSAGLDWAWPDSLSSWTWDVPPGTPMTIDVYSDADEVELLLNGTSVGIEPCGPDKRFTATFRIPYAEGELKAIARRQGDVEDAYAIRTAGPVAAVRATVEYPQREGGGRVAFVAIELTDEDGVVVPTAERKLSAEATDELELIALGTGRPSTTERFDSGCCTTFEGRAHAIVRLGGERATLWLRVEGAPGIDTEVVLGSRD